jgi:hypothetical protein
LNSAIRQEDPDLLDVSFKLAFGMAGGFETNATFLFGETTAGNALAAAGSFT